MSQWPHVDLILTQVKVSVQSEVNLLVAIAGINLSKPFSMYGSHANSAFSINVEWSQGLSSKQQNIFYCWVWGTPGAHEEQESTLYVPDCLELFQILEFDCHLKCPLPPHPTCLQGLNPTGGSNGEGTEYTEYTEGTYIQKSWYSPMMEKPHHLGSSVCLLYIYIQSYREVELPCTTVQGDRIYCIQIHKEEGLLYVAEHGGKVH